MHGLTYLRKLALRHPMAAAFGLLFAIAGSLPVQAQTSVQNTATVALPPGSAVVDSNPANNTSTVTVGVQALPRLTLVKQVVNDNGGTALATAWTLTATGPATTISGVTGSGSVTNAPVAAGTYALSESAGSSGYVASTWSCSKNGGAAVAGNTINLVGNDVATCTITNNDQAATLTLVKTVINDNGGTATVSSFPLTATGPTTITGVSGTAAVTNASVNAGVYTLSEVTAAGYAAGSWSCTAGTLSGNQLTLANGQSASCSITNNDQAATLTLVKTVINDNGGTATVSNFPLTATGPTTITGVSGTAAVTNASVNAGVYTLSEVTAAGYVAGSWSCTAGTLAGNQLTLANGQSASCSITNNDQAATLTLVKTVINDNGGTATISSFPLTATGPTTITGVSGTAAVTNASVNAGVYTLSEVTAAGYTAGAWNCTAGTLPGNQLTLANGQSASCSITNNDQAATLTLVKTVNGGSAVATSWTLSAAGPTPVSGAGGVSAAPVSAGVYTLSETGGVSNVTYTAGTWSCTGGALVGDQLTVANGESATCSITNTYVPPAVSYSKTASTAGPVAVGDTITNALQQTDIQVVKTASPDPVVSGNVITYSLAVSNNGPNAATNVLLSDTPTAGQNCSVPSTTATCSATGGASCPSPTVPVSTLLGSGITIPTLPVGGQVTVTLQCTVSASGL